VTANQVARLSGVSQATVSYVLNNSTTQKISEETRARVLRAVEELGYTPHEAARTLASGRSSIVLFVTPAFPAGFVVAQLFDLLSELLAEQGRTLLNHRASPAVPLADVVAALAPYAVISMLPLSEDEQSTFRAQGTRVEVIGFTEPEDAVGAEVVQPQRRIARLQAEHLIDRGHTRIGYALPDDDDSALFSTPRLQAVREVCAAAGLPEPLAQVVPLDPGGAARAVDAWIAAGVTAICAFNDEVAIAVLGGARECAIAVPQQLAVVGVDDIPLAALVSPPLTSVRIAVEAMARGLAQPLALESAESASRGLGVDETHIVLRESS